jgi:S-layer-related duplication domain
MKNLLKFATILLVLLAMVGAASAAVISIDSVNPSLEPDNEYSVAVSWTGNLEQSGAFSVEILEIASSLETTSSSPFTLTDLALTAGNTYTVQVSDDAATPNTLTQTFIAPSAAVLTAPVFTTFTSATDITNPNVFDLEWVLNTAGLPAGVTLQSDISGSWATVDNTTSSPIQVTKNANADTTFSFKLVDGATESPVTSIVFKRISATNVPTANSITWTLSTSDWNSYEYYVVKNGDSITGTPSANSNGVIQATGLDADTEYDLIIRGINTTNGRGLWTTIDDGKTGIAVINFIDDIDSNEDIYDDSSNTTKAFSIENSTKFQINMTANTPVNFNWVLKFDNSGTWETISTSAYNIENTGNLNSNFSWTPSKIGNYNLSLTMTDQSDSTKTQLLEWTITVTEKSTGNRIWDAGLGMPTTYTWDARSFAGFYYDLDNGEGSETMTITGIGRSLDKNSIKYETTTSNVDFAYSGWNDYQIVGFMGDKYYAGSGSGSVSESLMRTGNLSKVLIDTDDRNNYRVGQYIALEEGYSIRIDQISVNGNQAFLVIEKDGREVASGIVGSGSSGTFIYEKKIGNVNIPFIRVHVSSVFQGSESSLITIDGIFQISDKLTKLESGTRIDKMEITSVSGNKIEMTNHDRISLSQDTEVTLMGKMKFIVADSSDLRFAPTIEYVDPGVYEIRGTVSDYSNDDYIIKVWTPQNFEGFYYDINDDITNSEKIEIKQTDLSNSSRRIEKGNLTYTANVTIVDYEYGPWGTYSVIGFMGEKYYAGVGGSLLKGGNLSKVLIDADESRRMNVGQYLTLEDGYSIRIDQIDVGGNSTYLILEKDGRRVDDGIVRSGNDYVYKKNVSNTDVEFIKVHIDSVFMGTESSLVSISGLFQASDNLTKLENDAKYGKMKVDSYSVTGITLSSDESITLSSGNDVEFMKVGNQSMYFKVGDNSTLRFAPVVEREIGSTSPLEVKVSPSEVEVGSKVEITVMDRGTTIEGVTVSVNGSVLGTTNSSGMIEYTTNSVGTIRVLGEKSGYVNGSTSLTVKEKSLNMTISVSPETLYYGSSGKIRVTDSLNGSAVSGVSILVGDASAGTTDSNGELTYMFNTTGNVTIQGSKSGYINATRSVSVTQRDAFNYSNFIMKPDSPAAKSNIKLSFDATNVGVESGSHTLKLVVTDNNGVVIGEDSKTVSVDVGKTKGTTLSVKVPAEGNYRLTLTESDSNRVIDLPSSMSSISVGPSKLFGSTLLYIILAIIVLIVVAVLGFVAYLFGVKGATKDNYKEVAGDIADDVKMKFRK